MNSEIINRKFPGKTYLGIKCTIILKVELNDRKPATAALIDND